MDNELLLGLMIFVGVLAFVITALYEPKEEKA